MTGSAPSSNLLRANILVAGGTFLSRITGFLRVLAMAAVFGLSGLSDVYNTANTTPNIIYELMLGGILSATLLPMLVRQFKDEDAAGMSAVMSVIIVALGCLTLTTMLCAPLIIRAYAVARGDDYDLFVSVGTLLTLCFLPQIFFYGLISLATSALNARRKFVLPAYAPVLNNILVIGVLAVVALFHHGELNLKYAAEHLPLVLWLGFGTTAGIAISALVLLPAARQASLPLSFAPDWRHPAVQKVLKLSGWTLGYVAANQAALFLVTTLALHHTGGLSAYQTAFTFFLLPHGLFAVSITSTFSPDLAQSAVLQNWEAHCLTLKKGLRVITLLMLPAAIGYMLVAEPLVNVFLQHGRFDSDAAQLTSNTLRMFAVGLVPFSLYLFLLRHFYAVENTRTVFFLNAFENGANIAIAIPFMMWWGIPGLALSYALAYGLAAVATAWVIRRRLTLIVWGDVLSGLIPIVLSAIIMAAVVFATLTLCHTPLHQLLFGIGTGAISYAALLLILDVPEAHYILNVLQSKLGFSRK